ncbi:MAG TPA: DUF1294 domain-containing protein [Oleiagrimonas sp.]|nr:DUF1294 domain-containing protein [Oleiagrimonas sp.]
MRYQGKITEWRDERGFGFVTINGRDERIFLHIKAFKARSHRPLPGEVVKFTLGHDESGRPRAQDAAFVLSHKSPRQPISHSTDRQRGGFRPILATAFLVVLAILTLTSTLPVIVFFIYLVSSAITFIAYALDKSAAIKKQWRTAESTLQSLALIGGWPGALYAQHFLHHKSRKTSFQVTFWIVMALNILALCALFSAWGHQFTSGLAAFGPSSS